MTRNRIIKNENGTVNVRTDLPKNSYLVIEHYAKRLGITLNQALTIFWIRVEQHIVDRNQQFLVAMLGPDLAGSVNSLAVNDKLGFDDLPPISEDLGKLHRSNKCKSGFVGVYANGKGYRAMGCRVGGTAPAEVTIGTYSTAEQAAYARYLYYEKQGLVYGPDEDEVHQIMKSYGCGQIEAIKECNILRALGVMPHVDMPINAQPDPKD